MRLGWVKLLGLSNFFDSWLQPLEHLSSWRTMELMRLNYFISWPPVSAPSPIYKSQVISPCIHLPSPMFSSGTHPACPLFVFFGRTLPPWQQLCQTDRHTPITLEQMPQSFCHYQILLLLSPINSFNADIPVCPAKPLVGLETSLLCSCSESD